MFRYQQYLRFFVSAGYVEFQIFDIIVVYGFHCILRQHIEINQILDILGVLPLTANELKKLVYDGNRTEAMIQAEDVLSDRIYFYSRKEKALKIV